MSPSESLRLRILLEEPEAGERKPDGEAVVLRAGSTVRGIVEVEVGDEVDFRSFEVGFHWRTEGKGNRETGKGGCTVLEEEATWTSGTRRRFPFAVTVPWGPLSYSGKILKVRWALTASVDRSLLRGNVEEAVPVEIQAAPEMDQVDLGPQPQKKGSLEAEKKGYAGLWLVLGLGCLLGAVVLGAVKGWDFPGALRWLVFSLMVAGFLLTLRGIWRRLGKGKLGEPSVTLSTTELQRGEEIRFGLAMRPERRTEIRKLEVILECEERVVHGHGQYRSHYRKTVYERRVVLAERQVVEVHRGMRRKGTVTIPTDAPVSFGAPSNQVVWWLRFQGDIVGWPDWREPHLLTVRP